MHFLEGQFLYPERNIIVSAEVNTGRQWRVLWRIQRIDDWLQKTPPGTVYRIILLLALSSYILRNDFEVNTLQRQGESKNSLNNFLWQWLQLQEAFLVVLRMSVNKGHTRERPRNICGFLFRRETFHKIYCSLSHHYEYSVSVSMVGSPQSLTTNAQDYEILYFMALGFFAVCGEEFP